MAALSEDRATPSRSGDIITLPIAASVTCYGGALAVVKLDGKVRPGIVDADSPDDIAIGRFKRQCTAAVDVTADIEPGIFRWDNHSTDPVTVASLLKECYVADDHTVAATSATSTRCIAGLVVGIDGYGVWVKTTVI